MACRYHAEATPDELAVFVSGATTTPFGYLVRPPATEFALPTSARGAPAPRVQVNVADQVATMTAYAEPRDSLSIAAAVQVRPGVRAEAYAMWDLAFGVTACIGLGVALAVA